ncbi:M48 family metallopeptidase [Deinococcus peraridilitoris]|uniref:Putative metal-dependent hydrolase n=1 Tax=Deinococcus peraridilitoris (strain DSM 19664 / LMG 22246 / CIP 109416 / KR-200) TaxID=937777 RepID=L0A2S3_DEIPD|nr:SprT family zinc-dependent metalloprotease [Deinococcus peraridilitoris]AFZ67744.1 putative metal-dependent hydrolase [Deinococcus peraridilitoris DSM 19664]
MKVDIRRSARRRTLALRVTREGVTLHAPQHLSEAEVWRWVEQKREWIEKARQHFDARCPPVYQFVDGEKLPCLGEELTVRRTPGRTARRSGNVLEVPDGDTERVRRAVEAWYRAQALAFFTPLAHDLARRLNREVRAVKLTNARTRWGSCTASGELRLNWRVLLGPRAVAEYLCAHEVAHLREFNHSVRFWRLVAVLMPEYAAARAHLREHGWRYTLGGETPGAQ